MWELRFVAVHDDGEHVVVVSPDLDDEEFLLPITDELRDALAPPVRTPRPDPAADQPLTPREIQSRIRGGEAPAELARASGVPVDKIDRFAGPVLAERAHVAGEARGARLSWSGGEAEPGSLGEVVAARLEADGVEPDAVEWDAWRRDDAVWMVQVSYPLDGARHTAEWSWDPVRRQLRPYGAAARALSTSAPAVGEAAAPEPRPAVGLRMVPSPAAEAAGPVPSAAATPAAGEGTDEGTDGDAPDDAGDAAPAVAVAADAAGSASATSGTAADPARADHPDHPDQLTIDVREPAPARRPGRQRGRVSEGDERDGVTRRAAVPSWDDILFGVRRER